MRAVADLVDAWGDLVHGAACLGCGMPGRPWCSSCGRMVRRGVDVRPLTADLANIEGACGGDYDGWLRELILAHKERSAWSLAVPLGEVLGQVAQRVADADDGLILVPIPSRTRTVRARGHDPTLRMTRRAALSLRGRGIDAQTLPLLRLRLPVKDSVGLRAAARARNLEDAFALRPGARAACARSQGAQRPARIVICDDVLTTGATMREASAGLALGGLRASGIAVVAAVRAPEPSAALLPAFT